MTIGLTPQQPSMVLRRQLPEQSQQPQAESLQPQPWAIADEAEKAQMAKGIMISLKFIIFIPLFEEAL